MIQIIREIIDGVIVSKEFTAFFEGVPFVTPEGKTHLIKIQAIERSTRQPGYRIAKYSYVTKMEPLPGLFAHGYGESDVEFLAVQKSIAEAVERSIFLIVHMERDTKTAANTNGWAAHLTPTQAKSSAKGELLERDAILLHWLSETPLTCIEDRTISKALRRWTNQELSLAARYNKAKYFVTQLGEISVASSMIHDDNGFGFISHATGSNLNVAVVRALGETCRIADLATLKIMERGPADALLMPDDHAVFYADGIPFPNWIYSGRKISFKQASQEWTRKKDQVLQDIHFSFNEYQCGPLSVVHCKSRDVQNLFFGATESALSDGEVNIERIKKVSGVGRLCPLPHFVP
jgi:YcaO cyclodehydratase, ATP-ad Mg2+-binding